ncbi:MAG: hypothetical protein HOE90_16405 [Bacteriovoracaceae bacterium]|jgi:hypothetical protein|nr:hypothetical protein [Bacteriovoracaceae bacterium]
MDGKQIDWLFKMVDETLEHSDISSGENPFDDDLEFSAKPPKSPGYVFAIDKKKTTFKIHGKVVSDLAKFYESLDGPAEDPYIQIGIKSPENKNLSEILYFPTEYIELSESIHQCTDNYRFTLFEDCTFNIGDPNGSWWLFKGKQKFEIRFGYPGGLGVENYIKLGKLGDSLSACSKFKASKLFFEKFFELENFEISERKILIESSFESLDGLNLLSDILAGRAEVSAIYEMFHGQLEPGLYYYLRELKTLADFWKVIEPALDRPRDPYLA